MKHRKYGGSTAARTIACPGWHKESEGIPRGTGSIFAATGTALHDCMERIVLEELEPSYFSGMVVNGITVTPELVRDKLEPALEAFNTLCDTFGVTEFEPEVECSYADDIGGYADLVLYAPEIKTVIVADWKFGDGTQVFADDSPQAKFYGMAARRESNASDMFPEAEHFVAAIIQPNDRDLPDLRTWRADISVLDEFEKQHQHAVKESKSKHPPLHSGSHCQFCPAAPVCPQKTGQVLAALRMDPEDLDSLTDSLDLIKEIKPWITAVERVAFEQLTAGCEIDGWKLVQKRATEKWLPEREAELIKKLRLRVKGIKNMQETKLLSPAKMRKLLKSRKIDAEVLDGYTVKTSSGNTMAPEDDKRPAVLSGEALSAALQALS